MSTRTSTSFARILAVLAPAGMAVADEYATKESCSPFGSPVIFGCTSTSDEIMINYDVGLLECSGALTLSQSAAAPVVSSPTADSDLLYTLLLVDTTESDMHPILHFGAVNMNGQILIDGINLDDVNSFSAYRGPSPPPFIPEIRDTPFNYEWILVAQTGVREDPDITSNVQFDYEAFLPDSDSSVAEVTSYFTSGFCVETIGEPACKPVETIKNFDLAQYASAKWYSLEQRPTPFQPATLNYCVTAEYSFLDSSDPAALSGYDIHVLNLAEDAEGNTFSSDDKTPVGPTAGGPLCGAQNAFQGDGPAELTVGQCFLPPTTFGQSNYWVVAYDEDDGYALISGGQPDVPTGNDGLCTFGSPFNGLWIFSRSPERNEGMIEKYRSIAVENGIDPSVMIDVNHENCDEAGEMYVQVQGTSSASKAEACWEVRNGNNKIGNKIVLGPCAGEERNLFLLAPFTGKDGNMYVHIHPKIDPDTIVTGVRASDEKAWVRIEHPSSGNVVDETQSFYALESGMVGLGTDSSSCSNDETCLFITNQGIRTDVGDPVMLSTKRRLDNFAKRGDVIVTWSFI